MSVAFLSRSSTHQSPVTIHYPLRPRRSTHDYLAYGEELTDPEFQTNRMKFTGHERDPETGLDYMLARYYTSGSGRFLQVDPGYDYKMEEPMAWNLYSYTGGNPIRYTDPTGMVIDDSAAENDKKYAKRYKKWKKKLLSTKVGRALWNKLDAAKAVVKISFSDNLNTGEVGRGDNYKFDSNGNLESADLFLSGAALGPDGVGTMYADKGYVFGSTLKKQSEKKLYLFSHELGHIEDKLHIEGVKSYLEWKGIVGKLKAYKDSFSNSTAYSKAFSKRPDMVNAMKRAGELKLRSERYADKIGESVVIDWRKK